MLTCALSWDGTIDPALFRGRSEEAFLYGGLCMKSTLDIGTITLAQAELGPLSPLPDLSCITESVKAFQFDASVPQRDRFDLMNSECPGCLPYQLRDGYVRRVRQKQESVAVLENEGLRATFLLGLGGRLWSLFDKTAQRELLHQPDTVYFGGAGLRDAWFCGGIEWNVSKIGHAAHTCEPVFAGRSCTRDGDPILRLWEYDRFRGLIWQIDFRLSPTEPLLLVQTRIINSHAHATKMYWWSNVAVPENWRVLAPAEEAFNHDYRQKLRKVPLPHWKSFDVTRPNSIRGARDFYYRIPHGRQSWIAAVDEDGAGLVQTSTRDLCGRKLFAWGMQEGGRKWQRWLGCADHAAYAEIQAGLTCAQMQYKMMTANTEWHWLEAYGPLRIAATHARGNMADAVRAVEVDLSRSAPLAGLEALEAICFEETKRPIDELVQTGTGWGALEQQRRRLMDEQKPVAGIVFPDETLGTPQEPWLSLLRGDGLPSQSVDVPVGSFMIEPVWERMLQDAIRSGGADHWLGWFHCGVMAAGRGDSTAAAEAWDRSVDCAPSAWSLRCLAILARARGDLTGACDAILRAHQLAPEVPTLAAECAEILLAADQTSRLKSWSASLPPAICQHPRVQLFLGWCALREDRLEDAEDLISSLTVPNIREGETSLSDLWFEWQALRKAREDNIGISEELLRQLREELTPPSELDFRVWTDVPVRTQTWRSRTRVC